VIELPNALSRYVSLLGDLLHRHPRGRLMPGVRTLLDRLKEDHRWVLGLLSRNVLLGARFLLAHHGILGYFSFGIYADEHEHLETLPTHLLARAREAIGTTFAPSEAYVVGCVRRDLISAKEAGLRTVAVATGEEGCEALAAADPHLLFQSFEDVDEVLRRLDDSAFGGRAGKSFLQGGPLPIPA